MVRYAQLDISNLNLSEGKVALKGELGQLRCEKALQLTWPFVKLNCEPIP
ncbi:MAG: hypothetical protein R2880_06550 [Deinococcales bacterium]